MTNFEKREPLVIKDIPTQTIELKINRAPVLANEREKGYFKIGNSVVDLTQDNGNVLRTSIIINNDDENNILSLYDDGTTSHFNNNDFTALELEVVKSFRLNTDLARKWFRDSMGLSKIKDPKSILKCENDIDDLMRILNNKKLPIFNEKDLGERRIINLPVPPDKRPKDYLKKNHIAYYFDNDLNCSESENESTIIAGRVQDFSPYKNSETYSVKIHLYGQTLVGNESITVPSDSLSLFSPDDLKYFENHSGYFEKWREKYVKSNDKIPNDIINEKLYKRYNSNFVLALDKRNKKEVLF